METFKIKAMVAAAKCKSLSRAAEQFSYTPSAFSHILTSLEEELSVKLFDRRSTGVELTEDGKRLYPLFTELLESEEGLMREISQINQSKNQELRIGAYPSISRNLISRILKGFKKDYPNIKISINVADSLIGWLEEGRADIIFADHITFGKGEWTEMLEDRYYVLAPRELVGSKQSITLDELYNYPHIFTDDNYLKNYIDIDCFNEVIYFRSEDDLSIINMVSEGIGLAVLPELVIKENAGKVAVLNLQPEITRPLGFAYNKRKIHELGISRFIKSLKK